MCGRCAAPATPSPTCQTHVRSVFAPGIVGIFREVAKIIEEGLRLADEQSVIGEGFQRRHRRAFRCRGTNDGDDREVLAEELGRLRHDQVSLQILAEHVVGAGECDFDLGDGIGHVDQAR